MYVRTARLGNGQVSGNGEKAIKKECYGKVWRTLPHPFQLAPSPSLPVVVICPIDHRGPSQAHHRRSRPHREWNFFNHLPPSQPVSYTQTEWESFSRKRVYTNPFSSCQTFVKKIMRRLLETDRLPPFPPCSVLVNGVLSEPRSSACRTLKRRLYVCWSVPK